MLLTMLFFFTYNNNNNKLFAFDLSTFVNSLIELALLVQQIYYTTRLTSIPLQNVHGAICAWVDYNHVFNSVVLS